MGKVRNKGRKNKDRKFCVVGLGNGRRNVKLVVKVGVCTLCWPDESLVAIGQRPSVEGHISYLLKL